MSEWLSLNNDNYHWYVSDDPTKKIRILNFGKPNPNFIIWYYPREWSGAEIDASLGDPNFNPPTPLTAQEQIFKTVVDSIVAGTSRAATNEEIAIGMTQETSIPVVNLAILGAAMVNQKDPSLISNPNPGIVNLPVGIQTPEPYYKTIQNVIGNTDGSGLSNSTVGELPQETPKRQSVSIPLFLGAIIVYLVYLMLKRGR